MTCLQCSNYRCAIVEDMVRYWYARISTADKAMLSALGIEPGLYAG